MNTFEVAPAAQGGQVLILIVATTRTKLQMVWRNITPSTTGTLTAVAIASIDLPKSDFWDARAPRLGEDIAGEAQEGAAAGAVSEVERLPMPKIVGRRVQTGYVGDPSQLSRNTLGLPGVLAFDEARMDTDGVSGL